MGFANLERLCHTMEDIFQIIRSGSEEVSPQLGDLLLGGTDIIEQMLDDVESGGDSSSIDAENLLDSLNLWLNDHDGKTDAKQADPKPSVSSQVSLDIHQNVPENDTRPRFTITVRIADQCSMKDIRALLSLKNLESIGTVILSNPTQEALEEGKFNGVLKLIIASDAGEEALKTAVSGTDIACVEITKGEESFLQSSRQTVSPAPTAGSGRSQEPARQQPSPDKNREIKNLRVDVQQLDRTMNLIEELVIDHGRLKQIAKNLKSKELDETVGMVGRSITDLQDLIMTIRMIPLNHIFNRLPRLYGM